MPEKEINDVSTNNEIIKIIIERKKKEQEAQMFTHEWYGKDLEKRKKGVSSYNKVFEPYSLGG